MSPTSRPKLLYRLSGLVSSISIACFIVFGFYATTLIDLSFSSGLETFSGPRAYPRLILSAMMILVCALIASSLVEGFRDKDVESKNGLQGLGRVFIAAIALLFALIYFETLGFILTIPALFVIVAILSGAPNIWTTIFASIILCGLCLMIMRFGLNTILPEGLIGIDSLI